MSDLVEVSTEDSSDNKEITNMTMDPPVHSSPAEDFDIFAPPKVESLGASKQAVQDLFSFDPFSMDNLAIPTIPRAMSAGAEDDTKNLHSQPPQSSEMLSPMEFPKGGIVTDNSCANLLDFDLLGSVSEVTEENQKAQSERSVTGNWDNFDSHGSLLQGDGTALEPALGTSDTLDPFAGDYIDVVMEGASSPSPLMTPEVGSSNPMTPDEDQSSDPDNQDEEQNCAVPAAMGFSIDVDTKLMEEAGTQGQHDLSGFDRSEILGEIKDAQASLTESDEVNPIVSESVDISSHTPRNTTIADIAFDRPLQKEILPGFSKSETVHKVKHERLEYTDSTGSCDSVASYPFTPPNSIVDGFQPANEPFQLKEEALVEKIEKSLPPLNIEELDEDGASDTAGERKGPGEGSDFSKKIRGRCPVTTRLPLESTVNYQLSQQQNSQDTRIGESFADSETVTKGTTNVLNSRDDTNTQNKSRAFQLALAMELEETAIDDYDDEDDIDLSGTHQEVASAAAGPSQGENVIDQAIGQQINDANAGEIIINDEKDLDIDFAPRDIDSLGAVETKAQSAQNVMDVKNIKEIMSADGNMSKAGLFPENDANLELLDNFPNDLSPRKEHEGAIQQQLLPMATSVTIDNTGAYHIAHNMESNLPLVVSSDDGPVVHSRQNYQDLLSEEELPFDRAHGAMVTFVNAENIAVETSNSTFGGGEPAVNGYLTMEHDHGEFSEENEELREFVDNFINEEVIPAALEMCRAEQEIAELMENGDNSGNGQFHSNRFAHENEGFADEESIDIDVTPLHGEELPGNFVRLQITGDGGIAESSNIDNSRNKTADDNVVITEVDIESQGIFDITTTNEESEQITQDVKATQKEPLGPKLHESDFSSKADGVGSAETHASAEGNILDQAYNVDNNIDMAQVGDSRDDGLDVVAIGERSPIGDHHKGREIISTKAEGDNQEKQTSTSSDIVNQESNEDKMSEQSFDANLDYSSRFDHYEGGKKGYLERHSPTETTGNAVAYHIAQNVMTNNNPTVQQPNVVIDEYNDDNFNVPKSASTSSYEKESESTELTSSVSHSTVTSNEGEFIFGDDSESPGVRPNAPETILGYDNKSYESSTALSSEDDDGGGATVHGAAVEDGKLVYTAGSDVEAAYRFAQDVISNSVKRYEASKIVKTATDAALEIVKSDHASSAVSVSHNNHDKSSGVIAENSNSAASFPATEDKEDYPPNVDYHPEIDPGVDNRETRKISPGDADAAGVHDEGEPTG